MLGAKATQSGSPAYVQCMSLGCILQLLLPRLHSVPNLKPIVELESGEHRKGVQSTLFEKGDWQVQEETVWF
jgi:hypothetical protein